MKQKAEIGESVSILSLTARISIPSTSSKGAEAHLQMDLRWLAIPCILVDDWACRCGGMFLRITQRKWRLWPHLIVS